MLYIIYTVTQENSLNNYI